MTTGPRGEAEIFRSLGRIEASQQAIGDTLAAIHKAVYGNGQPGILQRLDDHGIRLATLEALRTGGGNEITWKRLSRIALLYGGILALTVKLLIFAITHHWPAIP